MAKKKSDSGGITENHDMLELGQKQRSGRMLSAYMRAIGSEVTEVVLDDAITPGPPRLISKAERLARWLWSRAIPHKDDEGNVIEPDLDVVKLVMDRVEGKPGVQGQDEVEDAGKESVPDRISRMNAERLNRLAGEVVEE